MAEQRKVVCSCADKQDKEEQEESLDKKEIIITLVRLFVSAVLALLGYFYFSEERFNIWVNFAFMASAIAYLRLRFDLSGRQERD